MGGHRVLRDLQPSSDFASRKALGFVLHKEPEGFEAGALRKGGEHLYCVNGFHISNNIDALDEVKPARVLVAAYEAYRRAPNVEPINTPHAVNRIICFRSPMMLDGRVGMLSGFTTTSSGKRPSTHWSSNVLPSRPEAIA